MELKEFVKKYQIAACQDGKDRKIRADSSIARCPSDIEYLKSHKAEIIQYLDSERDRGIAEENCPYEEKRMALGWTVTTGEPVWLRKLRKVK